MAVSTTNAYSGPYTANGSTTSFPFTFSALASDDVAVLLRAADGTETVADPDDYTVTFSGAVPSAGSVVFDTAPASGVSVIPYLDVAFVQQTAFADGSAWKAAAVNNTNDRSALRDQVLKRDLGRGLLVPMDETGFTLPSATDRAGAALFFDENGDAGTITIDDFSAPAGAAAAASAVSAAVAEAAAGPNYASTALGLAATTNGQAFAVDNGDGTVTVYLNSAGTAVEQRDFATTAYNDARYSQISTTPVTQRNLFDALSAQAGSMSTTAVIERRRTDYTEYVVYTPLTSDGKEWHRWYFSNRFSAGFLAAPTLIVCTLAYLYASTAIALPSANQATGTIAVSATDTKTPADATDTGTWTSPATVAGVSTTSYQTTAGATRTYTIDNSGGTKGTIFLRASNSAVNGGIAKVVVKLGGTEIASGLYTCPLVSGERIANYRDNQSTSSALSYIPICAGVGTGSITVELSESASNPVGGRINDAGVLAYNTFPYNTAGLYGLAEVASSANLMSHAGTSVVYQCTNTTRISWKYRTQTVSGIANFKVYDNSGTEIASYSNSSVDTYSAGGASDRSVEVAKGLTKGTYWLRVTVAPTKTGTRYALYDLGALASDETTAGVAGTDTFDVIDTPSNPSNSADFGYNILMGPANMNFAINGRVASEAAGVEKFLSGPAHGFETSPVDWALSIDGTDQTAAYNALAVGDTLSGSVIRVTYTTTLKSPTASQTTPPTSSVTLAALPTMGTLSYQDSFSGAGYRFTGSVAWSASVVIYRDYGVLLQVYSRKSGTRGVGGGMDKLAISSAGNLTLATYNDAQTSLSTTADAFAFANDTYAAAVKILNRPEVSADFADFSGTLKGNTNTYTTGLNKAYSDIVPSFSAGKAYSNGDGYTKQLLFRAFKGASMGEALGL